MISAGKRLHRESSIEPDPVLSEKLDSLKDEADMTGKQSANRLTTLEQVLHLAQYFQESEVALESWLGDIEDKIDARKYSPAHIDKGRMAVQ